MNYIGEIPESVWLTPSEARIDYNQTKCPGANEYILPKSLIKCSDCKQSLSECMCGVTNQIDQADQCIIPKKEFVGTMYGERVEVETDSPEHKLILWLFQENKRLAKYEVGGKMYEAMYPND